MTIQGWVVLGLAVVSWVFTAGMLIERLRSHGNRITALESDRKDHAESISRLEGAVGTLNATITHFQEDLRNLVAELRREK